jgi:hypothetical protein
MDELGPTVGREQLFRGVEPADGRNHMAPLLPHRTTLVHTSRYRIRFLCKQKGTSFQRSCTYCFILVSSTVTVRVHAPRICMFSILERLPIYRSNLLYRACIRVWKCYPPYLLKLRDTGYLFSPPPTIRKVYTRQHSFRLNFSPFCIYFPLCLVFSPLSFPVLPFSFSFTHLFYSPFSYFYPIDIGWYTVYTYTVYMHLPIYNG